MFFNNINKLYEHNIGNLDSPIKTKNLNMNVLYFQFYFAYYKYVTLQIFLEYMKIIEVSNYQRTILQRN